jgi:hypothetical protein
MILAAIETGKNTRANNALTANKTLYNIESNSSKLLHREFYTA